RVRKYFAARNSILFARRHGTRLQRSRLLAGLATQLPLELLWHVPRGTAGEGLWKLRGVRDGLSGRRPPFEALGLRGPPSRAGSGRSRLGSWVASIRRPFFATGSSTWPTWGSPSATPRRS